MNSLDYLDCSLAVFYNKIFISGSKFFSQSMKAVVETCSCAVSLGHLDFRLLCLAHIVEIRMNLLSVLFRDGSSSSHFLRKLFKFGAYANSLDHLDCSHGALGVFYNKNFISGSKRLSPSMNTVVGTCPCHISLDHLDFILLCLAHIATRG